LPPESTKLAQNASSPVKGIAIRASRASEQRMKALTDTPPRQCLLGGPECVEGVQSLFLLGPPNGPTVQ
jgi:hypothetical protein